MIGPEKLNVSEDFFKSAMIVISSLTGMYALQRYFRLVEKSYFREGIVCGITWLAINLLLDMIILVPMAKMQLRDYFLSIGLRYLQIPIICSAVGMILNRKFIGLQKS
jgi:hypothetical protein